MIKHIILSQINDGGKLWKYSQNRLPFILMGWSSRLSQSKMPAGSNFELEVGGKICFRALTDKTLIFDFLSHFFVTMRANTSWQEDHHR